MNYKVIKICSESQVNKFNKNISYTDILDPTSKDYLYPEYLEYEINNLIKKGFEFIQLVDVDRIIVKKKKE